MFELFSSGRVREFAQLLAQDIARRYPTAIANSPDQIVPLQRTAEILDEVLTHAHEFHHEHQIGLLSKVMLGHTFKRELREIGYDEAFVELAAARLASKFP